MPVLGSAGGPEDPPAPKALLPHRQLVKIAMESAFCASSCFLDLSLISLRANKAGDGMADCSDDVVVPNDFQFASSVIAEACSGEYEGAPTFQRIISNVAGPYLVQSLFLAEKRRRRWR